MSSDLLEACSENRLKEALRLLSTASLEDVNYREDMVPDSNVVIVQYYYSHSFVIY